MEDYNAKNISELNYVDSPIISKPLDLLLQELDVLFSTDEFEVLGNEDFGLSLDQYLGKYSLNNSQLKTKINSKIRDFCYMAEFFNVSVDVSFVAGASSQDILLVDVGISNQTNETELKKLSFIYR